jgi:hypothetical protein
VAGLRRRDFPSTHNQQLLKIAATRGGKESFMSKFHEFVSYVAGAEARFMVTRIERAMAKPPVRIVRAATLKSVDAKTAYVASLWPWVRTLLVLGAMAARVRPNLQASLNAFIDAVDALTSAVNPDFKAGKDV